MRNVLSLYVSYIKTGVLSMLVAGILLVIYAGVITGNLSPVFGVAVLLGLIIAAYLQIKVWVDSRKPMSAPLDVERSNAEDAKGRSATKDAAVQNKQAIDAVASQRRRDVENQKRHAVEFERRRREDGILREAVRKSNLDALGRRRNSDDVASSILPYSAVAPSSARIRIIGLGGGGSNALNRMIDARVNGVDFLAVNTDIQALRQSRSPTKLQIGGKLTGGLGAGGDPELGRRAALEDPQKLVRALKELDLVFLTAGLGGGTGTGAAPVFARVARELGILTVAVVTMPFGFEGRFRQLQAKECLSQLAPNVDTLIIIHNDRLVAAVSDETSFLASLSIVDDTLRQAVQGITDIIAIPGLINVDFADVSTIISKRGIAVMGTGEATGEFRARQAVERAIKSPILEGIPIGQAKGLLVNLTADRDLTLYEVSEAMGMINEMVDPDANIIFGAVVDEKMKAFRITVIATGFQKSNEQWGSTQEDETKVLEFRQHRVT